LEIKKFRRMKKLLYISFLYSFFLLISCNKPKVEYHYLNSLGSYQISNSPQKEWYVYSNIAYWNEYNSLKKYRNTFEIVWYSPTHFDLQFIKSSAQQTAYKNNVWVECRLKGKTNKKVLTKQINSKKVQALLSKTELKFEPNIKEFGSPEFQKLSVAALWQIGLLKSSKNELFFNQSALNVQLSLDEFKAFTQKWLKMFGGILWFKALSQSYQENDFGYAMDFEVGLANAKSPMILHLQWNKKFKVINIALQSGKNNQSNMVLREVDIFWHLLKKGEFRNLYAMATADYKKQFSFADFKQQMKIVLKLESVKKIRISSIESDFQSYGKNWAYYMEASSSNAWIGLNFMYDFTKGQLRFDKFIYIK